MIGLIAADLLKLRRRRALWLTTLVLPLVLAIIVGVTLILTDETDAPQVLAEDTTFALGFVAQILTVIVAARLGSEEHTSGTLRYQVLTGVPRPLLYASKAVTVLIVSLAVSVLVVVGALGIALAAGEGEPGLDGAVVLDIFWIVFLRALVFAAIAFGIGALLRSTGPAIGISIFLALGGANFILLLSLISESLDVVAVDISIDRLSADDADPEDRVGLASAIAVVVAYVTIPLAAGLARLQRTEP